MIVDTPGLHRPRTLLGERLNDVVRATLADVDVVGFCVPADQRVGPGDRFIAAELAGLRAPAVAIVTKTDAASKRPDRRAVDRGVAAGRLRRHRAGVGRLGRAGHAARRSARRPAARRTAALPGRRAHRQRHRNPGRRADPRGRTRGGPRRAAALDRGHRRGVTPPRGAAGAAGDLRDDPSRTRRARRASSSARRALGSSRSAPQARAGIEELLGRRVHLDLHVAVESNWQRDPKKLDRLGF